MDIDASAGFVNMCVYRERMVFEMWYRARAK